MNQSLVTTSSSLTSVAEQHGNRGIRAPEKLPARPVCHVSSARSVRWLESTTKNVIARSKQDAECVFCMVMPHAFSLSMVFLCPASLRQGLVRKIWRSIRAKDFTVWNEPTFINFSECRKQRSAACDDEPDIRAVRIARMFCGSTIRRRHVACPCSLNCVLDDAQGAHRRERTFRHRRG